MIFIYYSCNIPPHDFLPAVTLVGLSRNVFFCDDMTSHKTVDCEETETYFLEFTSKFTEFKYHLHGYFS